jgi:copper oxidase (laccase) domain-containing protein
MAWLGPAIGPDAFEVGEEVREAFVSHDARASEAFRTVRPGHWLADLYLLATQRLNAVGVEAIYGGGLCTFNDPDRFFSFRRDRETGRMASLIWIE